MMLKTFRWITVLMFALMAKTTVMAQTATGTVRGTVVDVSGALIPGAQVSVASGSGSARTRKSNAQGVFEAASLVPGRYTVTVRAKGFGDKVMTDVMVTAGGTAA